MFVTLLAFVPITLTVGDGKTYARIEAALAAAHPGDRIEVYASASGYPRTAAKIDTPKLTIVGMTSEPVELDGTGYEYSGAGSVPRAIFQIDADGVTIRNFELCNAHNASYNGAGVRVNQGKNAVVERCDIHDCDMGIMSNGQTGDEHAAENQRYQDCSIHDNGALKDPGYNHNLYLGGTSATLLRCRIWGSLTGHNLKSRAHFNWVQNCVIRYSANRECDFVEAWDTERPGSNAVLLGNLIVKDPNCAGNRTTINFGREQGTRNGTLFLINNTIVTPFQSAVVALSSTGAKAVLTNNVIVNREQASPILATVSNGANLGDVSGSTNWFSSGYSTTGTALMGTHQGADRSAWPFEGPDYHVGSALTIKPSSAGYVVGPGLALPPAFPRYLGKDAWGPSAERFMGAG